MTFNVFITQPEMEEQGESVFREDGWLPTTFILKAHHSFFFFLSDSCLGCCCWWLTSPGPARFSDNNEAGMAGSVPSLARSEWECKCWRDWNVGFPFLNSLAPGDRQAGNECGRLSQFLGTTAPAPGSPIWGETLNRAPVLSGRQSTEGY